MAHRLRTVVISCVTATMMGTLAVAAAPAGAAELPGCALGRLPAALKTALPAAVAAERRRFERSAADLSKSDRTRAADTFEAGVAAYVYGMPTVLLRKTVLRYPRNSLVGVGRLATPQSRGVVAPNHDTLYSVSRLELHDGPLVIDAPATAGRYSVFQLMDAHTNSIDYIGSAGQRDAPSTTVVVPPGYTGAVPPGARVVRSPTNVVWLLGRTLVEGEEDLDAATLVMRGYGVTPLADWLAGTRRTSSIVPGQQAAQAPVALPRGVAFFDALVQALADDPPIAADTCALEAFAAAGVARHQKPSANADPVIVRALAAAEAAGDRVVDVAVDETRGHSSKRNNGWSFITDDTGRFGTNYAHRAAVARIGLASNIPTEAVYPNTETDSAGRRLSGRHDYVITFRAGELPPVRSFWSLTLYDSSLFLAPNAIDRYALGDRSPGVKKGRGGSLRIYVQRKAPPSSQRSNWLPAPAGAFSLYLRLYEPSASASSGRWRPPTVKRTR